MQQMIKLAQKSKFSMKNADLIQLRLRHTIADGHHGQSDAISGGTLRGLCDRGSRPECSILARKVSACQKCVHSKCLDNIIMPLAVVLLSIAAFLLSARQSSLCTAVLCVGLRTVHGIWELKGS